ncbi:MAG TPA: hypothetical protein VFN02_13330 [Ktedonobacteraceae bacterium]|jgi:hypothetical protein|nr:hypothetical protein [Ktedonobacteraceae bacterium]
MQQRYKSQLQSEQQQRLFRASEVAEFEYCPLTWWYGQFEPLAQADTEELFARLVELEHEHGSQATALPEYRMVEQLLLRMGAFDEGTQQHLEHAEEVEDVQEEAHKIATTSGQMRLLVVTAIVIVFIALLFIAAALVIR